MRTVAALYVDPRGPYLTMRGVDAWPKTRNAKRYQGPHPVVAHPDCGPWSKLRTMSYRQDPQCGIRAVRQVRTWGGVLEHPQYSGLWDECELPLPGCRADQYGGQTFYVQQLWWGHTCIKPTWLYCVGIDVLTISAGMLRAFRRADALQLRPTHCVTTGERITERLPVASKKAKVVTPPAFADWLVKLARTASC